MTVSKRLLHRRRIGGVDHDRRLDLLDQLFIERRDVLNFVPIRALQADVDDMRAVFHLPARDFGRLFPLVLGDHVLEEARTNYIRALADDQRAVAVVRFDQVLAGKENAMTAGFHGPRLLALHHLRNSLDVGGRRAAASADDVEPAVVDEPLEVRRDGLRVSRYISAPHWADRRSDSRRCGFVAKFVEGAEVVRHEFGAGATVETY